MGPINYAMDVQSPIDAALKGYGAGAAIREDQLMQQQRAQQAEAAQRQQQEFARDMQGLFQNPGASLSDFAAMTMKYPQYREQLKQASQLRSEEQKQDFVSFGTKVYSALRSQNPEVARQLIEQRRDAAIEGGDKRVEQNTKLLLSAMDIAPHFAKNMVLTDLAGIDDKVVENLIKTEKEERDAQLFPDQKRKGAAEADEATSKASETQSKAAVAAVAAKYAESNAALDVQKKGWDITKIQEDIRIAKLNAQIAAANVAAAREGNALKREELSLKIDQMKSDREKATRERVSEVESARSSIDNLLDTADQVLKVPMGTKRSAMGPIDQRLPTISQDVADFEELVNTMGSQVFLAQVPAMKGLGALTEAEGARLTQALKSFSLRQSPEVLDKNVAEIQRLMIKARKNLSIKYGVPESVPDTPSAAPAASDIDALVNKYAPR